MLGGVCLRTASFAWGENVDWRRTMEALPTTLSLLVSVILLVVALDSPATADEVTVLYECVGACEIPPAWTVERHGAERSDTWGDPYPCGGGMKRSVLSGVQARVLQHA